jgi:hypothetical protein
MNALASASMRRPLGRLERDARLLERGRVSVRRPDLRAEHAPEPTPSRSARSIDPADDVLSIAALEVVDGVRGWAIGPGGRRAANPAGYRSR